MKTKDKINELIMNQNKMIKVLNGLVTKNTKEEYE